MSKRYTTQTFIKESWDSYINIRNIKFQNIKTLPVIMSNIKNDELILQEDITTKYVYIPNHKA